MRKTQDTARDTLELVLAHYGSVERPKESERFRLLIRIVLSQNTSSMNQVIAFNRLDTEIGVNPSALSGADIGAVMAAVRPAGMYRQRAKNIKEIAEIVLHCYGGRLDQVLSKNSTGARSELLRLPGVGKKTADVFLLFSGDRKVIPIDRHIKRIAYRTGMVRKNAGYDDIERTLEEATEPDRYLDAHLGLIRHGREICRARSPRCGECFLRETCATFRSTEGLL